MSPADKNKSPADIEPEVFERMVHEMLSYLGEDPERTGLQDTPKRVRKALEYFTRGYHQNINDVLNNAIFEEECDEMVIVRNIDFFSLCEHHMLPFYGKAHVAYIPNGKIVGLSKIPRLVEVFSRRLQIQERMTQQIARTLNDLIHPKGVGVVVNGFHLCVAMRGVEKLNAMATTSAMLGTFRENRATRAEFMGLIETKAR